MRGVSPLWLAFLAVAWWALASPRSGFWQVGLLAVAVGLLLHAELGGRSRFRPRWRGLFAFLPFFLDQMVRSGVDVSRRALSSSLPLSPRLLRYRIGLPEGLARVFFINSVSLLPGTFSAHVRHDEVTVHLLSHDLASEDLLRRLEEKVAALFGLEIDGRREG